jgi:hypothetical protein
MQQFKTKKVLFLGEQDGVGERALKARLRICFADDGGVDVAYLARVSFAETPKPQVALCLKGLEERAKLLIGCVGKAFNELFGSTQHLDILFLSETQLAEITLVARPFYSRSDQDPA